MSQQESEDLDERTLTGISGLDFLLDGGLPARRLHLIEGDPGTGKTTLALQFLMEGRARGETCLYVALSETATELRGVAKSHGWSLAGLEVFELARPDTLGPDEQYTLYHPSEIELGEMVKSVLEIIDRTRPSRVVFDSLSEMRLLAREPLRYRRQILALKEYFAGRDCTVLMLDDHTSADNDLQLQSIAHGVVLLEQLPFEYGRSRRRDCCSPPSRPTFSFRHMSRLGTWDESATRLERVLVLPDQQRAARSVPAGLRQPGGGVYSPALPRPGPLVF